MYSVPALSPVMVCAVPDTDAEPVSLLSPVSLQRRMYRRMSEPPSSSGGSQLTASSPAPAGDTVRFRGGQGWVTSLSTMAVALLVSSSWFPASSMTDTLTFSFFPTLLLVSV